MSTSTLLARCGLLFWLTVGPAWSALALQEVPSQAVQSLQPFNSAEGFDRLARSPAKARFAALANQFEAQSNIAFCGPTTAAIVLNALFAGTDKLPRDHGRLRPEDARHLPKGWDLSVPRFTQDSVIAPGLKTRAQVLGQASLVNGLLVSDGGYQLHQLDEMLRANGARTQRVTVDDSLSEAQVRQALAARLQQEGGHVIVNYRRDVLGQQGGAHISPLAAFDAQSDSVLIMDVNPANAGWVWAPIGLLIKAMRTFDAVENRGYILVH